MEHLLAEAFKRTNRYIKDLQTRRVSPSPDDLANLRHLNVPLQDQPIDAINVLAELDDYGSAATVAGAGRRYFGFVTGGTLPAPLAANILAVAWDQNAAMEATSPTAAFIEEVCRNWLVALLGLPEQAGIGFVTGATVANFTGLAAARHALLNREGWDVESRGLFGAPPITVIAGEEAHVSVLKSLGLLGLGRDRIEKVPVDDQGRMRADCLPPVSGPTIICLQAGNVNTGAFDPAEEICTQARKSGVWVHVDGAFGLWAAISPQRSHLVKGVALADSWATDAHKWLNVPYDSGLVFVRDARHLSAAMPTRAAYLVEGRMREPSHYVPELSRRARGIEIWAALRSLGKKGLADLIEGCCRHAMTFAEGLREAGYQILNDVILNQVLVKFKSDELTERIIKRVQEDGTCWSGGTRWQGHTAMRISVSSWATRAEDVEQSLKAIIRIAQEEEAA
jgi:glutamate/tyrosine decarboxylase-like PLP-dependent enzyme